MNSGKGNLQRSSKLKRKQNNLLLKKSLPEPLSTRKMSNNPIASALQHEEVFEAIARVMVERGSGIMTLDEIASKIGATKGKLYYYFRTKDEMLYRMQMHVYKLIMQSVLPILNDKSSISPRERLGKSIGAHILVVCTHLQQARAIWMDLDLRETPEELRKVMSRTRKLFESRIRKLIEDIISSEDLEPLDAKIVMLMMFGLIGSVSLWYRKDGYFTPEQMSDYIVGCVLDGLLQKPSSHVPVELSP